MRLQNPVFWAELRVAGLAVSRMIIRTLAAFIMIFLAGCDGRVQVDINSDETVSITQEMMFDAKGCKRVKVFVGKQVCGGVNPDGKQLTRHEKDTGFYIVLDPDKRATIRRPFSELGKENIKSAYDSENRTLTLEVPVSVFQNMSDTSGSHKDNRALVATNFNLGPPEIFDGHTFKFTVSAAEILQSNGKINAARTEAVFIIPSKFITYGIGGPGYKTLFVKARY